MPSPNALGEIKDARIREYLEKHLDDMAGDVSLTLKALSAKDSKQREAILASGLEFSSGVLAATSTPAGWRRDLLAADMRADASTLATFSPATFRKTLEKALWNLACHKKADNEKEGEPNSEWMDLFNKDATGAEIVKEALTAAFIALGAAWGPLGALLGTTIGAKIADWVKGYVAILLDRMVEKQLTAYCKLVP